MAQLASRRFQAELDAERRRDDRLSTVSTIYRIVRLHHWLLLSQKGALKGYSDSGTMKSRDLPQIIAAALLLTMLPSSFASAKASGLDKGIALYRAKNYAAAKAAFRNCIQSGENSASAWLYLGHAYAAKAETAYAMQSYVTVTERFADTTEATIARSCLVKLDPHNSSVYLAAKLGSLAEPSKGDRGFIDRVSVYHALPGHPRICQATVDAVQSAVASLPPQVNKYLCDGKATLTIAPNIADRWPGSGDGAKPTDPSVTMGEEPARTYGRDIFIYERTKQRGADVLLKRYSGESITNSVYHEIGHAVDEIGGVYSAKPEFRKLLAADLSAVSDEEKRKHSYFLDPGEAFAEAMASLLCEKNAYAENADSMVNKMTGIRGYVKKLFRL